MNCMTFIDEAELGLKRPACATEVQARVLKVDVAAGRLSLGLKPSYFQEDGSRGVQEGPGVNEEQDEDLEEAMGAGLEDSEQVRWSGRPCHPAAFEWLGVTQFPFHRIWRSRRIAMIWSPSSWKMMTAMRTVRTFMLRPMKMTARVSRVTAGTRRRRRRRRRAVA